MHEALDLARHGDDNVNAAELHLEQFQHWEEELRQRREEGVSSPTDSEDESETDEQGITSTDEKEWAKNHSDDEETASVTELCEVNEWMKKFHQYVPKDAWQPSTLEELFSYIPKNANWYHELEQRVNQAKNDRNHL
ncbi:unnamed protein product, partial [Clonostachys solani]